MASGATSTPSPRPDTHSRVTSRRWRVRVPAHGKKTQDPQQFEDERAYIEETFKPLVLKCKEENRMIRIGTHTAPPTAPQPLAHDSPHEVGR